jgi:NAD(P)H-dependent flavin oxidoreductase YrpB (nitropropane dioxygenase family)
MGIAAALTLEPGHVKIGTAFLRCPEAQTNAAWADALAGFEPEATVLTRAFSGRLGRSIETDYTRGAKSPEVPVPAPYPAQGGLTAPMRQPQWPRTTFSEWRRGQDKALHSLVSRACGRFPPAHLGRSLGAFTVNAILVNS